MYFLSLLSSISLSTLTLHFVYREGAAHSPIWLELTDDYYLTCIFISMLGTLITPSLNFHGKIMCVHVCSVFVTLWALASQASLSMEFSRQEYWSGLPFHNPGDLPYLGIEPRSPALLHCRWILCQLSHEMNRKAQISIPVSGEISRGGREHFCPLATSNSCFHTERAVTSLIEIGRSDWTQSIGISFSFLL